MPGNQAAIDAHRFEQILLIDFFLLSFKRWSCSGGAVAGRGLYKVLLLFLVKEQDCAMKNTILAPLSNGHRLSWASRLLVMITTF